MLQQNQLIDSIWTSLTRDVKVEELRGTLKEPIFKKWINLRAQSFVDAWMQRAKRKRNNISIKSEPSLRKNLNRKNKGDNK